MVIYDLINYKKKCQRNTKKNIYNNVKKKLIFKTGTTEKMYDVKLKHRY